MRIHHLLARALRCWPTFLGVGLRAASLARGRAHTMTRGYTQGEGDSLREELAAHIPAGDTIEGVLRSPEFSHVRVSVVRAFACFVWRVCKRVSASAETRFVPASLCVVWEWVGVH